MNQQDNNSDPVKLKQKVGSARKVGYPEPLLTADLIKHAMEDGTISKASGDAILEEINDRDNKIEEMRKAIATNAKMPILEILKLLGYVPETLSFDESLKFFGPIVDQIKSFNLFEENRDKNSATLGIDTVPKMVKQLFAGIDLMEAFGICYPMANVIYHLVDLLDENIDLMSRGKGLWEASCEIIGSYGVKVKLTYSLAADTRDDAKKHLEYYVPMMKTQGLLTLMAFWKVGNKFPSPEFSCHFIEIMKCISSEKRTAFFEPDERERRWNITRILQKTIIKFSRPISKQGDKVVKYAWIEQPLVEILGGVEEESASGKYPLNITVRLWNKKFDEKYFSPALFKNVIFDLEPQEILPAAAILARHGQRKREPTVNSIDWKRLIALTNQERTAKTNPRVAKARIRKTFKKFIDKEILESAEANESGICSKIKPFKSKPKKTKKA